jgi:hypothetical protein
MDDRVKKAEVEPEPVSRPLRSEGDSVLGFECDRGDLHESRNQASPDNLAFALVNDA